MRKLSFHSFIGAEARVHADALAQLRLKVFSDYPYLYEGTKEYEVKYLETYFKAKHSFIYLVKDDERNEFVGATTGIHATEEEESFRRPFLNAGFDPEKIFYFGESVLLPEYRGLGLGKSFFVEREKYARSLGFIKTLSFCAVVRPEDHPMRPADYRPLDDFWKSQGFSLQKGLTTQYAWQDRNEDQETKKLMQFWMKHIS